MSKWTTILVLGVLALLVIVLSVIYTSGPSSSRECRVQGARQPGFVCQESPAFWVYHRTSAWQRFKLAITGD